MYCVVSNYSHSQVSVRPRPDSKDVEDCGISLRPDSHCESGGYDCYTIFRQSDRTCHRGFNNKPTAEQCCEMGAEAVGINGMNGHCQPCWEM